MDFSFGQSSPLVMFDMPLDLFGDSPFPINYPLAVVSVKRTISVGCSWFHVVITLPWEWLRLQEPPRESFQLLQAKRDDTNQTYMHHRSPQTCLYLLFYLG
jgi:hypothetical protein